MAFFDNKNDESIKNKEDCANKEDGWVHCPFLTYRDDMGGFTSEVYKCEECGKCKRVYYEDIA